MIDSKLLLRRLLLGAALAAACTVPDQREEERPTIPAEERLHPTLPWTDAFENAAVLLAAEVRIEGPVGLLRHVATVSDPGEFDRVEKTVSEGFLQEVVVKPDAAGAEIRAQLDKLSIVATHRLSVLERPGPVDVLVVARGDAYWAQGAGNERRGDILRLDGKIAR